MRLLKSLVFAACMFAFLPLPAQTSQSQSSANPGPSQASPAQIAPQEPGTGFIRNPLVQAPGASTTDPKMAEAMKRAEAQAREALKRHMGANSLVFSDSGIYAKNDSNMCGTIVSYNFSQGADPHLENVTTCTPSKGLKTQLVERDHEKAPTPALVLTK